MYQIHVIQCIIFYCFDIIRLIFKNSSVITFVDPHVWDPLISNLMPVFRHISGSDIYLSINQEPTNLKLDAAYGIYTVTSQCDA